MNKIPFFGRCLFLALCVAVALIVVYGGPSEKVTIRGEISTPVKDGSGLPAVTAAGKFCCVKCTPKEGGGYTCTGCAPADPKACKFSIQKPLFLDCIGSHTEDGKGNLDCSR